MDRQRIDKWFWFARVVKTRVLAQRLAQSGHVRLNGRKVVAAAQNVRPGDVLTIGLAGRVRVLKVKGFCDRRGSSQEAQALFEELGTAGGSVPAEQEAETNKDQTVESVSSLRQPVST